LAWDAEVVAGTPLEVRAAIARAARRRRERPTGWRVSKPAG